MDQRLKATAKRSSKYSHRVAVRSHSLTVDEPTAQGGTDLGPTPQELLAASLASCTAVTIEMYASCKGWELGPIEVACEYSPAERGAITSFELVLKLPRSLSQEQQERLKVIAAKCPVHRTLDGEVMFDERIELVD